MQSVYNAGSIYSTGNLLIWNIDDFLGVPRWSGIKPPMYDPPVQFQSGEYRSPDYLSGITLSSAAKSPSDKARGFNFSSPYSINSFFSVSYVEDVHQCLSTSVITQNSSEMSHDADADRKESNKKQKSNKTQKSNSSNMSHDADADRKESNKEEKPSKAQKSNSSKMSHDADADIKESNKEEKSSKTQKSNSSNMSHDADADRKESNKEEKPSKTQKSNSSKMSHDADADRKKSNKKRKSSKTQKSNSSNMSHDADADRKDSNKKQKSSKTQKSNSKMPFDINADISESTKSQMSNIKMTYNAENALRDTNKFLENPNSSDAVSSTNGFANAADSLPYLSGEPSNSAAASSKARNLKVPSLKKETIQSVIDVLRSEKNNFRRIIFEGQLLYALGYLQSHMKDIITTDEWQKFLNEDTSQAVDFLIQAARLPSGKVPYSKTWM